MLEQSLKITGNLKTVRKHGGTTFRLEEPSEPKTGTAPCMCEPQPNWGHPVHFKLSLGVVRFGTHLNNSPWPPSFSARISRRFISQRLQNSKQTQVKRKRWRFTARKVLVGS